MQFEGIYISLVSGITYGLIISLLAAGLSLIYGVMKNVNTAHGAFYMVGGFMAFFATADLSLSPALGILFAFGITFAIGVVILLVVVPRSMWVTVNPDKQNIVMILLLAVATIFQQSFFIFFGGASISVPPLLFGSISLPGGIYVSYQTAISAGLSVLTYVALYLFLRFTRTGKAIRSFSQDRALAEALGVSTGVIAITTFGIGVSLASLSGSLFSSIYSVNATTGWDELVIAFVIVTLGGIGSITGSIVGGLIYGILYSLLEFYYPSLSFVVSLLVIYLILIVKPTGILGEIVERA